MAGLVSQVVAFLSCAAITFFLTFTPTNGELSPTTSQTPPTEPRAIEPPTPPPSFDQDPSVAMPLGIDARFWGVVFDSAGEPVDGAIVTAVPQPDPPPLQPLPSLAECLAHLERVRRAEEQHTIRATTDAEGTFDLGPLLAVEYSVEAQLPNGQITFTESAKPGWYLELRVPREPLVEITLDVSELRRSWGDQALLSIEWRGGSTRGAVTCLDPIREVTPDPSSRISTATRPITISPDAPDTIRCRVEPGVELRARHWRGLSEWVRIDASAERVHFVPLLSDRDRERVPVEVRMHVPEGVGQTLAWIGALEVIPGRPPLTEEQFIQAGRWKEAWGGSGTLFLAPGKHYRIGAALRTIQLNPQVMMTNGALPRRPGGINDELTTYVAEAMTIDLASKSMTEDEGIFLRIVAPGADPNYDPRIQVLCIEPGVAAHQSPRYGATPVEDEYAVRLDSIAFEILDGRRKGELEVEVFWMGLGRRKFRIGPTTERHLTLKFEPTDRLEVSFQSNLPEPGLRQLQFHALLDLEKSSPVQLIPEWEGESAVFPRWPGLGEILRVTLDGLSLAEVEVPASATSAPTLEVALEPLFPVDLERGEEPGMTVLLLGDGRKTYPYLQRDRETRLWLPRGVHTLHVTQATTKTRTAIEVRVPSSQVVRWSGE